MVRNVGRIDDARYTRSTPPHTEITTAITVLREHEARSCSDVSIFMFLCVPKLDAYSMNGPPSFPGLSALPGHAALQPNRRSYLCTYA